MTTPHKHAALIHAWADGKKIEYLGETGKWILCGPSPMWDWHTEYRIKPRELREWWVAVRFDGQLEHRLYGTEQEALAIYSNGMGTIHVREVME